MIPTGPHTLSTSKATVNGHYARTYTVVLALLPVQLLLLLSSHLLPFPSTLNSTVDDELCPLGRIYVYDLPAEFNRDVVEACHELNPWNSRCKALSNSGLGLRSTDLTGVVPEELLPAWFATDQFAGEIIYHRRVLGYRCRTSDPAAATAFYLPFYAGLSVGKYLWGEVHNNHTYTAEDRDRLCSLFLAWVAEQPPWRRSGGSDHFIMLGRITWDFRRTNDEGWGSSFLYMPDMANVTRLLIERNPWDDLDVGVPYPTGFHPRSLSDVRLWQDHVLSLKRSTLFSFAGAPRRSIKGDFRGVLLSQCSPPGVCRSLDCSRRRCVNGMRETLSLFLDSEFCLQPRGDSFTRRSVFDCMVAGAIPVLFWNRTTVAMYEWYLPAELAEYAVVVDRGGVRNGSIVVREVLQGIGEERRRRMRERIVGLIPTLVYAQPPAGLCGAKDAFDVAMDGVLRRTGRRSS